MSFATLKRNQNDLMSKLKQEANKLKDPDKKGYEDDRYWKPERDKSGNGYAVVRFLPQREGEDMPWVRLWNHGFQGPGVLYIENSLTTLNKQDPVSEYNTKLWNNGTDAGKDAARRQKRKLTYVSNIYVVKDPANPENEGKVFLYKYGKKIFDKLTAAMQPEFEDETAIDPFDFWQGANFKLKAKNVAGYRNYDSSEFTAQSPLLDDDDALEALWKQENSLQEFVAADQFKSYDELKKRLEYVLGNKTAPRQDVETIDEDNDRGSAEQLVTAAVTSKPSPVEDDEDDTLSYFSKLAED